MCLDDNNNVLVVNNEDQLNKGPLIAFLSGEESTTVDSTFVLTVSYNGSNFNGHILEAMTTGKIATTTTTTDTTKSPSTMTGRILDNNGYGKKYRRQQR